MVSNVALLSEATPAPQSHARGQVTPVSAAGVNDLSALARQQLPSAVPAASLIAAFSAAIQQQLKPAFKPATLQPSSALAAQFIGQGEAKSEEELQIFLPRAAAPTATRTPEDDYIRDLKIARGDVAITQSPEQKTTPTEAATQKQQATELPSRAGFSQLLAGLPALTVPTLRRPSFFTARGVSAYQLTLDRNAGLKKTGAT